MNKTIIIAGDSWGCGEWGNSLPHCGISHVGLTKYLLDSGYCVVNLSGPGGSNKYASDRISDFLQVNQQLQISYVIVFQTEWLRDVLIEDPVNLKEDLIHGYIGLKNRLISRFYYKLSRASVKNNIPIHIVGGCGDTIWLDQFEKKYPGLQIICQSLTNLLVNGDHRNPDPVHCIFSKRDEEKINYIKKHLKTADLELLLDDIDKGSKRVDLWANNKEYFWPDGCHANRQAHQILFEFLKAQIPSL